MPDEAREPVLSLGYELVARLAPEELPLYSSLSGESDRAKSRRGKASSEDQILGFGAGEAMVLLTPMILEFARSFWDALAAQAADSSIRAVLGRARRGRQDAGKHAVPLTDAQLRLVRKVAEQQARRLNVSDGQAGLLADAVIGVLTAPAAS